MGISSRTRRQVFGDLKDLLGTVTGATYQERINVKEGPQGRANAYFDLGPFSDEPSPDWRSKTGTHVGQTYTTVVTFAFRLKVKDVETSRLAARDIVDIAQRAIHRATDSGGSPIGFEGVWLGSEESENAEREWLFFACRVRLQTLFDLTV